MTDAEVLEAFSRFDKDKSGSITREELGHILKSLNEEDWNDDAADQLLADADASGDCEL